VATCNACNFVLQFPIRRGCCPPGYSLSEDGQVPIFDFCLCRTLQLSEHARMYQVFASFDFLVAILKGDSSSKRLKRLQVHYAESTQRI
jgi:hypothetical protein